MTLLLEHKWQANSFVLDLKRNALYSPTEHYTVIPTITIKMTERSDITEEGVLKLKIDTRCVSSHYRIYDRNKIVFDTPIVSEETEYFMKIQH